MDGSGGVVRYEMRESVLTDFVERYIGVAVTLPQVVVRVDSYTPPSFKTKLPRGIMMVK
jgi:hypothetical protein